MRTSQDCGTVINYHHCCSHARLGQGCSINSIHLVESVEHNKYLQQVIFLEKCFTLQFYVENFADSAITRACPSPPGKRTRMPGPCVSRACPQIMDSVYKLKCNLCGIFAAQVDAGEVCSVLQPSCIKPVCDINTFLLHFD